MPSEEDADIWRDACGVDPGGGAASSFHIHDSSDAAAVLSISPRIVEATLSHRASMRCGALASAAIEIIKHRALKPRRISSRSGRGLIKKVWKVDPLLCPQCRHEMRIVSLINDAQTIERILRHVGPGGVDQWVDEVCNHGVRITPGTGPPVEESAAVSRIFDRGQLVFKLRSSTLKQQ